MGKFVLTGPTSWIDPLTGRDGVSARSSYGTLSIPAEIKRSASIKDGELIKVRARLGRSSTTFETRVTSGGEFSLPIELVDALEQREESTSLRLSIQTNGEQSLKQTKAGTLSAKLSIGHRQALDWFSSREGERIGWPDTLPSGLFLANKAKGIHKPKDWDHALSIRVMLNSDYEDGDIEFDADGRWHFRYHQEGDASDGPGTEFTNRALLRNRDDGVPVGVMRQVSGKPNVQYEVLGLGRVINYADGFFHIVGPVEIDDPLPVADVVEHFDPNTIEDARRFTLAVIHRRQGQQRFRQRLLAAYGGKCAISGCDVEPLLDAAHIVPYQGPETNKVQNGLLLRTDLHTLFDLDLLTIDPSTFEVRIAVSITQPEYAALAGSRLRLPTDPNQRPSEEALRWRSLK